MDSKFINSYFKLNPRWFSVKHFLFNNFDFIKPNCFSIIENSKHYYFTLLENILNIVNILTAFQLGILAYVLINSKNRKPAQKFLFSFLLVNLLLIIVYRLYYYGFNPQKFPLFVYTEMSLFLLLGPLVYLYTKSICYSNFKFNKKHSIHFISFFLVFIAFWIDYFVRSSGKANIPVVTYLSYTSYSIFFLVQLLVYIIAAFILLKNYRDKLKTEYSFVENIDLSWLQILLIIYLFHWLFDTLMFVFYVAKTKSPELFSILGIFSILTLLVFSTWAVIKGLKQLPFFSDTEQKEKYATSNLSKSESEMYITELINYMEDSKPYLQPSLKITDIAKSLSIPSKSLSQSINQQLGKNFYDFINSYRVEEAKKQIIKANGNGKTILEILYNSGFNSKAAFNRAFKKYAGVTPTKFKNSL